MKSVLKVGDRVILMDSAGIFTLEVNRSYEIAEIHCPYRDSKNRHVRMVDDDMFYNEKRFTKDIKFVRRQKIKKMEWQSF